MPDAEPVFPPNFVFGTSTSAYQIEANIPPSNWTLWERQTDQFGNPRAPIDPIKADGFNKFFEDAEIAHKLGCKMYRLSFSWSRLNPKPGQFDDGAMAVYRSWLLKLKEMGMEPLLTLWHFEHPAWVEDRGSMHNKDFVKYYTDFVRYVLKHVYDVCDYYHTVNEPIGYMSSSYLAGIHPPGANSFRVIMDAMVNLLTCHATAYRIIHEMNPNAKVSFSHAIVPFVPRHSWSLIETSLGAFVNCAVSMVYNAFKTSKLHFLWMSEEIPGLQGTLDFISLNHYYVTYITLNPKEWDRVNGTGPLLAGVTYGARFAPSSDMNWGMMPASLAAITKWIHKEHNSWNLPIMITEHGCADGEDSRRQWFLRESLWHLSMLQNEGVPVKGYLHWSLTDNYEWADGCNRRFGLVEIDYKTQERKPRKSAHIYSEIIKRSRESNL